MQLARRRLKVARYSIGAVAVTTFAAFGIAVRAAHPATHTGTAAVATATASTDNSSTSFGGSASISPAPQTSTPTVQSSGS